MRETAGYITARPSDFFTAVWEAISGAYSAMFRGAVFNYNLTEPAQQWRPLTETFKFAGPLILGGLGVGLAFRAGLFNIGGRGQMLIAGGAAGWVGFKLDLPLVIHLPLAILVGMAVGALWGGIAGVLKARTGAHEVIVTIMLNYVAYYLLFWALTKEWLLKTPGSVNPKSPPMKESATLPKVLGDQFNLHLGFVLALVAVAVAWWLLNRSTLGYRIRAVGENPHAARASGINVGRTYTVVMMIAGSLLGLAGVNQVLGTVSSGVSLDLDASIGFDAITVALLGRSRPLGHPGRRAPVRRLQGRWLHHADLREHLGRPRARGAVADRPLPRRPSPGARDLPAPRPGGQVSTVTDQPTPESGGLAPDTVVTPTRGAGARKLPIVARRADPAPRRHPAPVEAVGRHDVPALGRDRLRHPARHRGAVRSHRLADGGGLPRR